MATMRGHTFQGASLLLTLLCLLSCANPGSGPDGGPYDEEPPRLVGMQPEIGETDVAKLKKVVLVFSENVKLENPSEKIIISPPQEEMPEIKVSGRRVSVELMDSLKPDMTYTIDFSDAIKDATEGNPLGQFTYYFSTGENVDTMEVAGSVVDAQTLEPVKGILVGLYDAEAPDSMFTTTALSRVARTDEMGRFSVKGVARGKYRIYALKDMDGNFFWNRGEQLAFLDETLTTDCFPDIRYDTAWVDSVRWDSIAAIPYTHYLPDDVVLRAFNEVSTNRTLMKMVREVPNHFVAYFTAPSAHVPQVEVFAEGTAQPYGTDEFGERVRTCFLEERNETNDTITYWITDSVVAANDSLKILYTYEMTNDSTFERFITTDTLDLMPRMTNARIMKERKQADEKWQKQLEKRHKRGDYDHDERPVEPLTVTTPRIATLPPDQNLAYSLAEPIMRLDTAGIHLFLKVDSIETPVPRRVLMDGLRAFTVMGEWRPDQKYVVRIDSASIEGLSGLVNKPLQTDFAITKAEDVGSLFVALQGADTTAVVQLLQAGDKVVKQVRANAGSADFFYVKPGEYYLKLFLDENGNSRWDTGNYGERRQAEHVVYYPEQITIRGDWDTDITWNIQSTPTLQQKPSGLRKTKQAGRQQTAHEKNIERERKLRD